MDASSNISEKDHNLVDVNNNKDQIKKRKRLMSNRESARRSRLKKLNQLNSLLAEMKKLKEENDQMLLTMSLSNQLYLDMEAQNSVLRAQIAELNYRLQSLEEIINVVSPSSSCYGVCDTINNHLLFDHHNVNYNDNVINNNGENYFSMNVDLATPFYMNHQPTIAAPAGRFI
ncbi:hypothetical protein Ddye_010182 [Dipteronia dyeriana]|uniref:BZIP domain-containing protein n=1 Tax=Dipteronia dyeriana TaxID=168575 RepID=A0AAE0CMX1_9ROSI|nr:hypothetical protein Ddye_010182 [Dipteronia dyeriana]